jgi:hypothetical protein
VICAIKQHSREGDKQFLYPYPIENSHGNVILDTNLLLDAIMAHDCLLFLVFAFKLQSDECFFFYKWKASLITTAGSV